MGDEPNPMKPASPEQTLFLEALQRSLPEARAAYLDGACGTDTVLRRRVEALLHAAESADDFLEEPPTGLSGDTNSTSLVTELSEKPGDKIGRYKLLEKIGEGGCGVVYMAEQEEPVRRRVALKVIKLGMDTRSVVARFEAERQALALMDHPNISKVLDGGATQTGRPYFVMELVRGVRITEFCDEARLSTEARLRLFVQVCQAVQHAHQKGIIHRDLKPSNILVTVNDGAPVPKVIDFGIAKATGQRLTDKTLFTQFHSFIGTPAYISPEQAEMSSVDIDTRSDIYSLGVLLYELLIGQTPFNSDELLRSGLDEMRRTIRDKKPARPSNRLDTLGLEEATALSGKRKASVPELAGDVRGDLDWIVMKCLEKDRARRYETANGIAADIQRHLNHEPVTARPPSGMYLLQRLAQRNRGALITAATVLVALLVAVLALATSNARIRHERDLKDHALLERGAALQAARASEQRAREQLFVSLQSQAQARRNSRQMGQRLESLAALAEAARIRPTPELRDNAIAAMAIPDVEQGPLWPVRDANSKSISYDSQYQHYARLGQDGTISIRAIPDDRELQHLEFSPLTTPGAAGALFGFSPDGRFIAWLNEDSELRIWQWESGESVLKDPPGKCSTLAFSPDSRRVAVADETWITCFDLSTGEASRRWQTPDRVCTMDFHPDTRRLAVGYHQSNVVSIYNAADGGHVADLLMGASSNTTVAWHPDGNLLATGGSDKRIQIWDVKAQRKVAVLEGHAQQVYGLMFHWSGELLASLSWDGTLRLWQPSPGKLLMRLPDRRMGFSREGRWAGVISPSNDQAQLWGIVPSQEYHTFLNTFGDGECEIYEGDISPDGKLLALGMSDGVRLLDVARGREVAWLRMGQTGAALFRTGGRELLTCGPVDGLQRWRIEANAEPEGGLQVGPSHQIALPFAPLRIAKGRDERTLAVVGESAGECLLLDLVTESVRGASKPHAKAGYVALSPDAERLATSGWHSDRVKLWDGPSGRLLKELGVGLTALVFFTPDNRELIVARAQEFTFHDLNSLEVTRRMLREIGLHPGHVAFTADGKLMALEMAPGLIHLKEITSGRTVAKLEDPYGDVSTWMSFTPDGTQLVVAAMYAGAIHRWDLRAIRTRLKTMNLDWDWPEFSAPPPAETSFSESHRPLRVQLLGAMPTAVTQASATNASPAKP
jgi:serine/threonine protein kinase/WD40 repeat protein